LVYTERKQQEMGDQTPVDVGDLDIWITFSEFDKPEHYVWIPDSLAIMISRRTESTEERFCYTCLEHLFLLLNHIEQGESGAVLAGTGGMDVTYENEMVTLDGRQPVVGAIGEMKTVVRTLIQSVFEELVADGVDTRRVAQEIADGRISFAIDPVRVHDAMTLQ
jgi:hypothetical protein